MNLKNVLAIDDDSLAGEAIKMVFKQNGISVAFFDSPKQALEHLKENPEKYKMVIVDYQMTEMSGAQVVREVKKLNSNILAVVLSGQDSLETIKKCQAAGADNFYSKGQALKNLALLSDAALDQLEKETTDEQLKINQEEIHRILSLKGKSNALMKVAGLVKKFAPTNETILIQGASGTGKEQIAKAIHSNSPRKAKAFVAVNCGAIPENLLESELFGHEKGSFTGASHAKAGKFIAADGGTIFLDEIGEMPLEFQVKLLRVLQEKEVTPVGSNKAIKVNFRVVSATNRNLKEEVSKGNFREDLFYRLNILPIDIPSLEKRPQDIVDIALHIVSEKNKETGMDKKLTKDATGVISSFNWPGNVRQMEAVLKRAYFLNGIYIHANAITHELKKSMTDNRPEAYRFGLQTWSELENDFFERQKGLLDEAFQLAKGNKKDAARMLNIAYTTYISKRLKFGLDKKVQSATNSNS